MSHVGALPTLSCGFPIPGIIERQSYSVLTVGAAPGSGGFVMILIVAVGAITVSLLGGLPEGCGRGFEPDGGVVGSSGTVTIGFTDLGVVGTVFGMSSSSTLADDEVAPLGSTFLRATTEATTPTTTSTMTITTPTISPVLFFFGAGSIGVGVEPY